MDITKDIQPMTAFRNQSAEFVRHLKETGRPIVLTINGKASVVVQDAAAYQRLCDIAARAGQTDLPPTDDTPSGDMFEAMRRKLGLAL